MDSGEHGLEKTLAAVDSSLKNFGFGALFAVLVSASWNSLTGCMRMCATDYIDLMLLHSPLSGKERRVQAYKALVEARDKGKVRSIGVSN